MSFTVQLLEYGDGKWWPAGRYRYQKLQAAINVANALDLREMATVVHDGTTLYALGGKKLTIAEAMKHGTGTVNRLTRLSDRHVRLRGMRSNPQKIIRAGSRQVIINGQDGSYWANLYVNNGETITQLRWKGSTLTGAERWAKRVLSEHAARNPRKRKYSRRTKSRRMYTRRTKRNYRRKGRR